MCGVAAVIRRSDVVLQPGVLQKVRDTVAHRGPDDAGLVFLDGDSSVTEVQDWRLALAHRRLSILDLSQLGRQPMQYCGRYWLTYNGEVYNYVELRRELELAGHQFRSNTDSEVILAAFAEWRTDCFERFRGMWALCLYDSVTKELFLCRDRVGIKPLYTWIGDGLIAVVSEIKQLLQLPGFRARMNEVAAAEFLRTGYEQPARPIFRGIHPVPGGHWIGINVDTQVVGAPVSFWRPERIRPELTDGEEAARLFGRALQESVQLHLRSDVPVGCALSGGLDSSALAILAGDSMVSSVSHMHTFTSSFPGTAADERKYVDAVLGRLHAHPHFTTPDPERFLADLDQFVWAHDEPVGSLSVYAAYAVARLARDAGVPVVLNGQGGDEALSAYWQSYYFRLRGLARRGKLWQVGREVVGALLPGGNPEAVRQAPHMMRRYMSRRRGHGLDVAIARPEATNGDPIGTSVLDDVLTLDEQSLRLYEIRSLFLPRLLKWDDRNSMAFSIEGRYPFLDHVVIETALSFSPEVLYRRGWVKWPLRSALRDRLPKSVLWRRDKCGFEVPQADWLAKPLRATIQSWLNEDRPIWELVDRGTVAQLSDGTGWRSSGAENKQALFRVFAFDQWMARMGVSPDA